mgnify:CR=1 FL=1
MNAYESLSHTRWECKYHIVFIPKYRRKAIFGELRKHLGELFHELARRRRNFVGQHFWARGYLVSTVGKDEATVRKYIQEQEKQDQRLDQLEMFKR